MGAAHNAAWIVPFHCHHGQAKRRSVEFILDLEAPKVIPTGYIRNPLSMVTGIVFSESLIIIKAHEHKLVFYSHFNHQDMAFLERGKCQTLFTP